MTDELVAFLTARFDEDESIARAATPGPWRYNPNKHYREPGTCRYEEGVFAGPPGADAETIALTGETDDPQSMRDADHIARHDPARVLRDVAARRAILAEHTPDDGECPTCADDTYQPRRPLERAAAPCRTLRLLAAVYDDHPD